MKLNIPKDEFTVLLRNQKEVDEIQNLLRENSITHSTGREVKLPTCPARYYFNNGFLDAHDKLHHNNHPNNIEYTLQQFIAEYRVKEIDNVEVGDTIYDKDYGEGTVFSIKDSRYNAYFKNKSRDVEFHKNSIVANRIKIIKKGVKEEPKKSLIQQVNEDYKKGDKFIDLVNKVEFTVKEDDSAQTMSDNSIYVDVEPRDGYSNKSARVYKNGEWANILENKPSTVDYTEKMQPKNSKRVVNVTTQDQWDFVTAKLGYEWAYSSWDEDKEKSCIELHHLGRSHLDFFKKEGYEILSFYDWVVEFNHVDEWNKYSTPKDVRGEPANHMNDSLKYWQQGVQVSPQHFMCGCDMADPNVKDIVGVSKVNLGTGIVEQIFPKKEVSLRRKRNKIHIFKGVSEMESTKSKIKSIKN